MTNPKDMVETIAQFLHDEGGFDEAWSQHTWPEHPDDAGQREGGFVKIVPSDVQAKFREVAQRLVSGFRLTVQAHCRDGATDEEAAKQYICDWCPDHVKDYVADLTAQAQGGGVEKLREAAESATMYLETGFIECPQCGHEVQTKDTDAAYELREALSSPPAQPPADVVANILEAMKGVNSWLCTISEIDMDAVVADGGVTGAMVVQQEAKEQQRRLRSAIAIALAAPPQPPADLVERLKEIAERSNILAKGEGSFADVMTTAASYWAAGKHGSLPRDMLESYMDCIHEAAEEAMKFIQSNAAAINRPTPGRDDDMKTAIIAAYEAGALAVHENWQEDRDPDFTEAAHDYVASIDIEALLNPASGEG